MSGPSWGRGDQRWREAAVPLGEPRRHTPAAPTTGDETRPPVHLAAEPAMHEPSLRTTENAARRQCAQVARKPRPLTGPAPRVAANGGFTLLEVLVALAILSVAVVASIQGFAQGLRLLKLSGDHQRATQLADEKTREVIDPQEGQERNEEGGFTWERTTTLLEAPDLAGVGIGTPPWRAYQIAVRVKWDEQRQVEITTLRTVPTILDTGSQSSETTPRSQTQPSGTTPSSGPAR